MALGPNAYLIDEPRSRNKLATPALLLDLDRFERNVAVMMRLAREAGFALRPHGKTHKCVEVARRQVDAGSVGICCATVREAAAMVAGGIAGVLVTSPVVDDTKIATVIELAGRAADFRMVADNEGNVARLSEAATAAGVTLSVLVDVDIGMRRTGVSDVAAAIRLARAIDAAPGLTFAGVQGYSGLVQHIATYAERKSVYAAQMKRLVDVVEALRSIDLAPQIITGGGTGTFVIDKEIGLLTEHQAGSYIFMDVQYNAVELKPGGKAPYETALLLRSRVISNNADGFVTTDGGYKCFATDGPLPVIANGAPEGAVFSYFGDEHGKVSFAQPDDRMALGDAVELVTSHCDPTVNLHNYYHCVRGDVLVDIWPVDARGVI